MNIAGKEKVGAERVELQMTSMIDCVFLLLIFFVMTMKFPAVEGILPAHLPADGKPPGPPPKQKGILIRLEYPEKHLMILVDGAKVGGRMTALKTKLCLYRRYGADARITISGAPDVPYEHVVSVMNACAGFGFRKLCFAQPEGGA